jgi:hypothetical protein
VAGNSFTTDEYLRRSSLVIGGVKSGKGIDLSEMRFTFQTRAWDHQTLPTMVVRIYNLSDTTVKELLRKGEYTEVQLKAGYQEGWFGTIFRGTIKQFRTGRESPTDTFLDIFAADGDLFNWTHVNGVVPPGGSVQDVKKIADEAAKREAGITKGIDLLPSDEQIYLNGKVVNGMISSVYDDISYNSKSVWHVWGGETHFVPTSGTIGNEAIKLNSETGLVGMPEVSQDGVHAKCLLNPNIRPRSLIQINQGDINRVHNVNNDGLGDNYAWLGNLSGQAQFFASTAADGFYIVFYVEHQGDTRGNPWYTDIVCGAYNSEQNRKAIDMGTGYDQNATSSEVAPFATPGGAGPEPTFENETDKI